MDFVAPGETGSRADKLLSHASESKQDSFLSFPLPFSERSGGDCSHGLLGGKVCETSARSPGSGGPWFRWLCLRAALPCLALSLC